jgi:hypothetical protein
MLGHAKEGHAQAHHDHLLAEVFIAFPLGAEERVMGKDGSGRLSHRVSQPNSPCVCVS